MNNLPAPIDTEIQQTVQNITFHVGEELFGVGIMCVEEIIIPRKCTAIPRTPDYFLGIINLRGAVISVLDMRRRFHLEPAPSTEESRIIVIHSQGSLFGMLVDQINSIVTIVTSKIQSASKFVAAEKQKYITGSYRLDEQQILLLLNQENLIGEGDFHIEQELQASAESMTVVKEEVVEAIPELFLVGFAIGHERFAIESLKVEEIIQMPEITPVPEMDSFVEGIFHLRESVIPVIRIGQRMEVQGKQVDDTCPVIIVLIHGVKVGLIVDRITEVYLIKENEVLDPPITLNSQQQEQLQGVIKLERGDSTQIVMFLKLEELFSFEEQDTLRGLEENAEDKDTLQEDREKEVPILEFLLNEEKYAIEVASANEIIPIREIVNIPKAPEFIKGVINLRGDVISIIDLPRLVGRKQDQITENSKILVVETGHEVAGLIVDQVFGIRDVLLSIFEPPSDLLKQRDNVYIRGMSKDTNSDDIVILLDIANTLAQAQDFSAVGEGTLEGVQADLEQLEAEDNPASVTHE